MSPIKLGEVFRPLREAEAIPLPPSVPFELEILEVLSQLQQTVTNLPAPVIQTVAPDLIPIIEAIQNLRAGPTAAELGEVLAVHLHAEGQQFPAQELNTTMGAIKEALETLDFRLRGIGRAYGGSAGTVAVSEIKSTSGLATESTLTSLEKANRTAEWAEIASALNATATATRAAVAGQSHYITGIVASFDIAPAAGVRLDLREAGVNKLSLFVADPAEMELTRPFKMAANTTATLVLAAGGVGATGLVTMQGYTA